MYASICSLIAVLFPGISNVLLVSAVIMTRTPTPIVISLENVIPAILDPPLDIYDRLLRLPDGVDCHRDIILVLINFEINVY